MKLEKHISTKGSFFKRLKELMNTNSLPTSHDLLFKHCQKGSDDSKADALPSIAHSSAAPDIQECFGPLYPLLLDENVSEVMVNGPNQIYYERKGDLGLSSIQFRDHDHVIKVIKKVVSLCGRSINECSPMVEAKLPDGWRINAMIPPLALNGPTITIQKYINNSFRMNELIHLGTLSEESAVFLEACVKARLNIFVSGCAGSGKTTTLKVLSNFISNNEGIFSIEDGPEPQLILKMLNIGADGSLLATFRSNSPREMIFRMETMILLEGVDLSVKEIHEQIAGAIDVVIQQARLKDGTRRIVNITEVQGLAGDQIVLQDIFTFKQEGINSEGKIIGKLMPTGVKPKCYKRLMESDF